METSLLKAFGENVKEMRLMRKVSQETLAERCGLYRSYLSRVEKGIVNPTLISIVALANALEVDPSQLLLFSPLPHAPLNPSMDPAENGIRPDGANATHEEGEGASIMPALPLSP